MAEVDFRKILKKNGFNVECDLNNLYVVFKNVKVCIIDKSSREKVLKEFLIDEEFANRIIYILHNLKNGKKYCGKKNDTIFWNLEIGENVIFEAKSKDELNFYTEDVIKSLNKEVFGCKEFLMVVDDEKKDSDGYVF